MALVYIQIQLAPVDFLDSIKLEESVAAWRVPSGSGG
jgi:hypothetical protein